MKTKRMHCHKCQKELGFIDSEHEPNRIITCFECCAIELIIKQSWIFQ